MNKRTSSILKYTVATILGVVLLFNSVYFRKLSEVQAENAASEFNPKAYAKDFWDQKLIPNLDEAVNLDQLLALLKTDPDSAFSAYSNALGIGSIRYFMIHGRGTITSVNENEVLLAVEIDQSLSLTIATEFVFGNAVRDGSALIDINEFDKTMDFNNISAEVNQIIRSTVLPEFKMKAKKGDHVEFTGAIELNKEHLNLSAIEVVPIKLTIIE